jgi:hypothetical protein
MAKILVTKYEHQADATVCEVAHESQADLCWYEATYEPQARGDATWYFVDYDTQASFKIFKVKFESQADIKAFQVQTPEKAGWRDAGNRFNGKMG